MYTVTQYFLAKNLVELPEIFIFPLFTIPIYYFMTGLNSDFDKFLIHCLTFSLISFSGASLGLLVGSLVSDPKQVSSINSIVVLPFLVFSGFFKNRADLPSWISWI